ncbi:PTS fructose transporter subunit IIC [Vagococcus xieshaowenii]|uniref:PTS fructose transporter subunit IIC n=1 Tax=Vagococcus xieshaowenii TaxID=2562451 RepID=A0AAJ5EG63_9ENTE|nr:PTS fructose transporter subunit IIC [Vagococcus xieshaowenii]QCA28858.1 PTS fructose transporter subunit IIC [Vagococcus xieshaowenii]TFZ43435.1 PTS fructose transporter subunit IIC [Vagococcus xieshaowenii]
MAKIERKKKQVKVKWTTQMKNSFMTGVSYMIPVIVAGGIITAIGKAIGGYDIATNPDMIGTFAYKINFIGVEAMLFAVPVLCAGIAYTIGNRPAIAPALAIGLLSQEIKAGFIGGMLGGFLIGYMVKWIKTWKVPSWLTGMVPILIIPVFVTLTVGALFQFVLGAPIALFTKVIEDFLNSLQGGSKFIFGSVLGGFWGVDFGGPITKIASSFATALNAQGNYASTAAKMAAGMTPPLGMALAVFFNKKKFTQADIENAKAAVPLSFCYITEAAIPFAMQDPIRVLCSTIPGAALTGGLGMLFKTESPAVHGGVFVIPMMTNPLGFISAWLIGSVVTGLIYATIKKPLQPAEVLAYETKQRKFFGLMPAR